MRQRCAECDCGDGECNWISPVSKGQRILDAQKKARATDPRPSEEIVREMRNNWDKD